MSDERGVETRSVVDVHVVVVGESAMERGVERAMTQTKVLETELHQLAVS